MFAPYARNEVFSAIAIGGGLTAAVAVYCGWWALLPALLTGAVLSFYRDPPRSPPARNDVVIAPADGKIVEITTLEATAEYPRQLSITIFLSVANVHLNRAPCAGQVMKIEYKPGKFLNALDPQSNLLNEANLVGFAPQTPLVGPIYIRQIAGLLAKRIVCAVKMGQSVTLGERIGMIKLGSRTELRVPDDGKWQVNVAIGQTVRGARTIMLTRS